MLPAQIAGARIVIDVPVGAEPPAEKAGCAR